MKKANIALWFFGVLLIIAGLGSLGASLKGGLLYFLAGIILLPPIKDKLTKILQRDLKLKWFVLPSILLIAIAPIFIQADERRSIENGTASQELIAREARMADLKEREQEKIKERREAAQKKNTTEPSERTVAFSKCEKIVRLDVSNLGTPEFNWISGNDYTMHANGRVSVTMGFAVSTKQGSKANYSARCVFNEDGTLDTHAIRLR